MKTETRNVNPEPRDMVGACLAWTSFLSFAFTLVCIFLLSPAWYILALGLIAMAVIFIGTAAGVVALMREGGLLNLIIANEVIKGGFELLGVIAAGLLSVRE